MISISYSSTLCGFVVVFNFFYYNKLTSQLIKEQRIQPGDNLYLFLGLIKRCNNTQAIQTWISEVLDEIDVNDDQEKYQQLEHKFLKLMPEIA